MYICMYVCMYIYIYICIACFSRGWLSFAHKARIRGRRQQDRRQSPEWGQGRVPSSVLCLKFESLLYVSLPSLLSFLLLLLLLLLLSLLLIRISLISLSISILVLLVLLSSSLMSLYCSCVCFKGASGAPLRDIREKPPKGFLVALRRGKAELCLLRVSCC